MISWSLLGIVTPIVQPVMELSVLNAFLATVDSITLKTTLGLIIKLIGEYVHLSNDFFQFDLHD